jgi:hypothetical protein
VRAQGEGFGESAAPVTLAQVYPPTPSPTTLGSRPTVVNPTSAPAADARHFSETGFAVAAGPIYEFFRTHGGARVFGPPISKQFRLLGDPIQLFRYHALVQNPDGTIATVALLDIGAVPSNRVAGRALPNADDALLNDAPTFGSPNYTAEALQFIQQRVPDQWNGLSVGFQRYFQGTVSAADAVPSADPARLPTLALEVWGLPVSQPTADPQNAQRVFLRWENGVMEFDQPTGQVQTVPLGEAFKAILTGQNLTPDLATDAQSSPFFRQYSLTAPNGLAQPNLLPDTEMSGAFQPDGQSAAAAPPPAQAGSATATPTSTTSGQAAAGPDQCAGDEQMTFVPGDPRAGTELLIAVSSSRRHAYPKLTGTEKTTFSLERQGQLGHVWEWTVQLTYPGDHEYTFYVDSTMPCKALTLRVRSALATSTPEPYDYDNADNVDNFNVSSDNGDNADNDNLDNDNLDNDNLDNLDDTV